jgi:hypothetical protein
MTDYVLTASTTTLVQTPSIGSGKVHLYPATTAKLLAFKRWSENGTNGIDVVYKRYAGPTVV